MEYKVNSEIGPLRLVLTHKPGIEHQYVTPKNLIEKIEHNDFLIDRSGHVHIGNGQLRVGSLAFTDGDRAGGFILKELKSVVHVDYELRADEGIEVEELTPQRVDELLSPIVKKVEAQLKSPSLENQEDSPLADICKAKYSELNESVSLP